MKQISTLFIAVFLVTAITPTLKAQVNIQDSLALVDLYDSTGGPNWTKHTNWLTTAPVSSWYGIIEDSNKRVVNINLYNNNLIGSLPLSLGRIASLDSLELTKNQLSGNIPASLGLLSKLIYLDLSYNNYTFTGLEQLSTFFSGNNLITFYDFGQANVPIQKKGNTLSVSMGGTLKAISFTWMLNGNALSINFGDSTFTLSAPGIYSVIAFDSLANQFLYSSSDTVLINANSSDSLALVDLYNSTNGLNWQNNSSWLQAPLSTWSGIVLDFSGKVVSINLTFNNLTGKLPNSLGNMSNLKQLQLENNHLIGNVPVSLASLKSLTNLDVSNNYYTFGGLEPIANYFTNNNTTFYYSPQDTIIPIYQTSDSLTVSVGGTQSDISYNWNLNGALYANAYGDSAISPKVSGVYAASVYDSKLSLYLYSANDTIVLYTKPNTSDSLALVDLYNTTNGANWTNNSGWLKGAVSNWFGVLLDTSGRVTGINLINNNLTGGLPNSIGTLSNLRYLSLGNNHLLGNIPLSLTSLSHLVNIDISFNFYTFSSLESIVPTLTNDTALVFYYTPQDTVVTIHQTGNVLSVSEGGTPSDISYVWFLNGNFVYSANGDSTYTPTSSGAYYVSATDSKAGLTLYSATDTVFIYVMPNANDSLALVDFYNSTNGANWKNNTNWLTTAPLSTWNGITLDTGGRVSQINLYVNNLTGTLPNSIGNLTHLTSISLHINAIGGNIPGSIGNLTNLIYLDLGENKFVGTIPDSLASLTNLTQLDLDGNQLIGSIPSWIGNFTSLQDLWLQYNSFSDSIPSSIGNLTGLQYLVLQNNQLSGPIPASFSNLNNLQGLFLQNNNFTFDGMELIATKFPFAQYAPQAPIPLYHVTLIGNSDETILWVSVGGTQIKNTYNWYNTSGNVATINRDSSYVPLISDYYYVQVTDSLVRGLILHSDTLQVYTTVPIKAINLQAKETNGQVMLGWQTIDEINTASFTIQHSTNGTTFTDIATKVAVGSGNNSYSLVDKSPVDGINYYRIKAIYKNGSATYSSSVQISIVNYKLSIYPNPSKGKVTIVGNHISSVKVLDNLGREVNIITLHGANNPSISVGSLSAGIYYLHVKTTNGYENVVKLIKE